MTSIHIGQVWECPETVAACTKEGRSPRLARVVIVSLGLTREAVFGHGRRSVPAIGVRNLWTGRRSLLALTSLRGYRLVQP